MKKKSSEEVNFFYCLYYIQKNSLLLWFNKFWIKTFPKDFLQGLHPILLIYVRNLASMAVTAGGAATSMRIWVFTLHLH